MAATQTQTINLAIEVVILVLTIAGYWAFRRGRYNWHGQLMVIGFAMPLVSFLLVMVPSLLVTYTTFTDPRTVVFDAASIVHIPLGVVGMGLGGLLVAKWARNDYRLANMKATWLMRTTAVSWVGNVLLGSLIFLTMPSEWPGLPAPAGRGMQGTAREDMWGGDVWCAGPGSSPI